LEISPHQMLIAASTSIVLLLVLGLSTISIHYMTSVQNSMNEITSNHNAKVDLLYDMGKIVRQRSLHLHAMFFREDLWERGEEFNKFNALAGEFISLRDKFLSLELTPGEKYGFSEAMKLIAMTQPLQLGISYKLSSDKDQQARKLITEKDLPLENKLIRVFDRLIHDLRTQSLSANKKANSVYQISKLVLIFLGTIILIVVGVGAYFVSRRIASSEKKLFEEKERAEVTLNTIVSGVITTDVNGRILTINPAAANMIECEIDCAIHRQLEDMYCIYDLSCDAPINREEFCQKLDGPSMHINNHHRLIGCCGREIIIEEIVSPIFDTEQNVIQFTYTFRDVSYERDRTDLALRDPLTGAMNRRYLETEMQRLIYNANEINTTHGFLYIDIDYFKNVNDTYGHMAGDKVLHDLSVIMLKQVRKKDVLVRLGGDEFVVLVKDCNLETARIIAEKILESFNNHTIQFGQKILSGFSASIGISMIRSGIVNSGQILEEADRACYQVKKSGRNGMEISGISELSANELAL